MKKYLGSVMTAFAAIISPCFIVGPVVFGVFILTAEISVATAFLFVMCLSCSILWSYYLWKEKNQLYSWGHLKILPYTSPFRFKSHLLLNMTSVKAAVSVCTGTLL